MPLYEYRCADCDQRFEVLQRMGEGPEGLSCPRCGETHLSKEFSTFASTSASATTSSGCVGGGGGCGGGGFT